jgi:periplasmic copper chaperone A
LRGTALPTGTPVLVTAEGAHPLRRAVRGLVIVAVTVYLVGVMSAVAFAHVVVTPDTAVQGGYAALTFRVPNERDDASTTKIEVQLPVDSPLASISVKPHPGWSYKITKTKPATPVEAHGTKISEVVGTITWTVVDSTSGIKPGEYEEFSVSAGPLPETDMLVFKTLQHYSDDEVVRWIQEPASGADEPERPAPVVRLVPRGDTQGNTASVPSAIADRAAPTVGAAPAIESGAGAPWAVGLSVASLVISLACAAMLAVRWRRAR